MAKTPVSVLVADDDQDLAKALCEALTAHGYAATAVHSGDDAVERVGSEPWSCLLMDVELPGMDGFTALPLVTRLAPTLPVLLMTGDASERQAAEARRLGAYALLRKPFDLRVLLNFLSLVGREEDLLVFGDDRAAGDRLGALLDGTGYRVENETEPERVLDHMRSGYKLAVLLDVAPGSGGDLDVLRSIRAAYPTKPVLMMAAPGTAASEALRDGLMDGAYTWLPKPVQRHLLVDIIDDIRRQKLAAVLDERMARSPPPRVSA